MLAPFRELLEERRAARAAAGAFTCYDVTTALGVVRAAEERDVPVILLVSEASFRAPESRLLVPALVAVAANARVATCVQIDHVSDPGLIWTALAAGVGAVLADGSRLPLDENAALVRRVVEAAPAGVGIEAELGHIQGGEDVATAAAAGAFRHRGSTGIGSSGSASGSGTSHSPCTVHPACPRPTSGARSRSASARSTSTRSSVAGT